MQRRFGITGTKAPTAHTAASRHPRGVARGRHMSPESFVSPSYGLALARQRVEAWRLR